jgi:hypothetical protein
MKKEKSMSILGLNMLGSDITKPEKELRSLKRGEKKKKKKRRLKGAQKIGLKSSIFKKVVSRDGYLISF